MALMVALAAAGSAAKAQSAGPTAAAVGKVPTARVRAGSAGRGTAAIPATPPAGSGSPARPLPVLLQDGTALVDLGQGYERVVRSCAAYARGAERTAYGYGDPAPQGGSASRPPGAGGAQPVPGLAAVPGLQPAPGVPRAPGAAPSVGGGSLEPLHSGYRTAGRVYYDRACWMRDDHGRIRLIHF